MTVSSLAIASMLLALFTDFRYDRHSSTNDGLKATVARRPMATTATVRHRQL